MHPLPRPQNNIYTPYAGDNSMNVAMNGRSHYYQALELVGVSKYKFNALVVGRK